MRVRWPGAVIGDIEICTNPMTAIWLRTAINICME
jgi:hypothetical protein